MVALLSRQVSTGGAWVIGVTGLLLAARIGFGIQLLPMTRSLLGFVGRLFGPLMRLVRASLIGAWERLASFQAGVVEGMRDSFDDWQDERELAREERKWQREERLAELEERRLDEELGLSADVRHGSDLDVLGARDSLEVSEPDLDGPVFVAGEADAAGPDASALLATGSRDTSDTRFSTASRVRRPTREELGLDMDALLEPAQEAGDAAVDAESLEVSAPDDGSESSEVVDLSELPSLVPPSDRVDSMCGATGRGVVHAELRVRDEGAPRIHESVPPDTECHGIERVVSARRLVRKEPEPYDLPALNLLESAPAEQQAIDETELETQAARLEETLAQFKVAGRVTDILPGPVVTMFEFEPAPGIKVSKIAGLGDDLAMALRAVKVRIVAPIPGKGAVGIEVPSKERETVYVREIMASKAFRKTGMQLPLALGKGIDGGPVCADMAKMPHLLVAGTTGSGKSVCVNSIILSMLYRWTPEEVRLILVDPKMLEFSVYEDVPHLLVPVVTSPKKAAMALKWAVTEMTRRYQVLSAMNTRNIVNYNSKCDRLIEEWDDWEESSKKGRKKPRPDCGRVAGGDAVCYASEGGEPVGPPDKMPYIVVVIDELADLMMVARKDVEESIVRLAQMARAAGIHLLLATQRPSTDVITGLIKANFPGRISFRVSSMVDSRTVLDANGAEKLLGMGDALFLPPGTSDLTRVHGAFVSDDEIQRVVDHVRSQREPDYVDMVLTDDEGDAESGGQGGQDLDAMYDQAVAVVAQAGKASTSLLQRRLKLGYNRAARIIDSMEQQGVIGPADGARPREVYILDHGA